VKTPGRETLPGVFLGDQPRALLRISKIGEYYLLARSDLHPGMKNRHINQFIIKKIV
jgi:hypothetical protein